MRVLCLAFLLGCLNTNLALAMNPIVSFCLKAFGIKSQVPAEAPKGIGFLDSKNEVLIIKDWSGGSGGSAMIAEAPKPGSAERKKYIVKRDPLSNLDSTPEPISEVAAYELDQVFLNDGVFGSFVVPRTELRQFDGKTYSFQNFLESASNYNPQNGVNPRIRMLDLLIGNSDRDNGSNLMLWKGRQIAIDNARGFQRRIGDSRYDFKKYQENPELIRQVLPNKKTFEEFRRAETRQKISDTLKRQNIGNEVIEETLSRYDKMVRISSSVYR